MYNFTIHNVLCFYFPYLLTQTAQWRCVCAACYCITQCATYVSTFGCRQFTTLHHVYCKSVLTAVTCVRLVSGQSYLACFILYVCY